MGMKGARGIFVFHLLLNPRDHVHLNSPCVAVDPMLSSMACRCSCESWMAQDCRYCVTAREGSNERGIPVLLAFRPLALGVWAHLTYVTVLPLLSC